MRYKHLSIIEREKILFCIASKFSLTETTKYIGRDKPTISRELKRKIYCQIKCAIFGFRLPDNIFVDSVFANVI